MMRGGEAMFTAMLLAACRDASEHRVDPLTAIPNLALAAPADPSGPHISRSAPGIA
jgi:hypothetical protein